MHVSPSRASTPAPSQNPIQRKFPQLYSFWKFTRPHTVVGTSLSVLGLYLLVGAGAESGVLFPPVTALIATGLTCLCGNVYIVGLNQLEDIEIDRVNKPHLPLASGEYSRSQAQWIVGIMGGLALVGSALQGIWLLAMVWLSLLIGTLYSLPPVRLKRFPVWAALCIFSVRGAIVNLGLFLHFNALVNPQPLLPPVPPAVWTLTVFILVFTFAIAIFKDIPDLEGDRRYHISTFTVRLGGPAVFKLARWVLTVCYAGMIAIAPLLPGVNVTFLIITHLIALIAVWVRSRAINLKDIPEGDACKELERRTIAGYYQFIWKLFFLEYLIFPLAHLLS